VTSSKPGLGSVYLGNVSTEQDSLKRLFGSSTKGVVDEIVDILERFNTLSALTLAQYSVRAINTVTIDTW
jgi:hypothetical protein